MYPLFCTLWLAGWAILVPPSLTCLEDLLSLFSTLSKAHLGYLHLVIAFLWWSFSCWSNSGLLHTVEALWERVWITLNLAERWWWLSHCKYWSVMCGFPVHSYGQRTISLWFNNSVHEGDGPILLVVLYCEPYSRVNTVNVLKEALLVGFLVDDTFVIHIPVPVLGGWGQCLELFVLSTPCRDWPQLGLTGEPMAAPSTCS